MCKERSGDGSAFAVCCYNLRFTDADFEKQDLSMGIKPNVNVHQAKTLNCCCRVLLNSNEGSVDHQFPDYVEIVTGHFNSANNGKSDKVEEEQHFCLFGS